MLVNCLFGYLQHKQWYVQIAEENNDYVKKLFEDLFKEGIKCEVDLRNEKINYKIREHSVAKSSFDNCLWKKRGCR